MECSVELGDGFADTPGFHQRITEIDLDDRIIRLSPFHLFQLSDCLQCLSALEKHRCEIQSRFDVTGLKSERDFVFVLCMINLTELAQG